MADLIDSTRAKYNLGGSTINSANQTLHADESTTLSALITAVSKAIKKWCRREFDSQTFDEIYQGTGDDVLQLREYPIISIARVAASPTTVLRVRNTSSANQRATVSVGASGLSLTRVASGSSSTDTSVTWAGNATITAVATEVDALGNGWDAEAVSGHTLRASADLRQFQGALNAKDMWADLQIHTEELACYSIDSKKGWLYRRGGRWDRCTPSGPDFDVWCAGEEYRVIYTAGYATVPEDVQEACAQWVARLFWATKRDSSLQSSVATTGAASGFMAPEGKRMSRPPEPVALLLEGYRRSALAVR